MKKSTWIWIIALVIIIVIVAVNWKKISKLFKGDGGGDTTAPEAVNVENAQEIADKLYQLMKGVNVWWGSDRDEATALASVIASANDETFKAIWNAFGTKDGYNLASWVDDEWYMGAIADKIKNRASSLGLS